TIFVGPLAALPTGLVEFDQSRPARADPNTGRPDAYSCNQYGRGKRKIYQQVGFQFKVQMRQFALQGDPEAVSIRGERAIFCDADAIHADMTRWRVAKTQARVLQVKFARIVLFLNPKVSAAEIGQFTRAHHGVSLSPWATVSQMDRVIRPAFRNF